LAVALAGKETLENLIASFTIFLDKPFIVGDLIQVGNILGTVEKVGFRSTRIRTSEKSLLTIPNKQLVDQPLDNQNSRSLMRVKLSLVLEQSTPNETITSFTKRTKEVLGSTDFIDKNVKVWFSDISINGVEIQVVFYVKTNDADEYLLLKEKGNFLVKGVLEELNIQLEKGATNWILKHLPA
jgi:MscS family membrane protein